MDFDPEICRLRETLAANIRRQRKTLGLTQDKLAETANLSSNMVNDIEGGRTWVSDKTIIKLAKALNLEVYELMLPDNSANRDDFFISKHLIARLKRTMESEFDKILRK